MKGYMYILECGNGRYYVGSTDDLKSWIKLHQEGKAARYTAKHPPIKLVYFEEFKRLDLAFDYLSIGLVSSAKLLPHWLQKLALMMFL